MELVEWLKLGRLGVEASLAAVIAAVASAAAVIITATRKRKDVDVNDLLKRVKDLDTRVENLETALDSTRKELITADGHVFVLRRTLAAHGIPDPTVAEAS